MPQLFPWAIFVLTVQKIGCRPIRIRSLLGIRRLYHANVKKSIVEAIKQSRALVKTFKKMKDYILYSFLICHGRNKVKVYN